MTPQPDLAADIDRWNIDTLMLLNRIRKLRLGPAGYCSERLDWIIASASQLADDRRRIEAVLAERSKP